MIKTILICAAYIAVALSGMTLIKAGYDSAPLFSIPFVGAGISLKTLCGILLYGISFLIFVLFVSRLKVSIVIPVVSGLHCALTVVVGIWVFHEQVSRGQIVGIALIVAGTVLVGILQKTGN